MELGLGRPDRVRMLTLHFVKFLSRPGVTTFQNRIHWRCYRAPRPALGVLASGIGEQPGSDSTRTIASTDKASYV